MKHPPRFDLDGLVAGALDPESRESIMEHLAACADCRRYVEDREKERSELLDRMSPQVLVEKVESRRQESPVGLPGTRRLAWGLSAAVVIVVALSIWLVSRDSPPSAMRWMGGDASVRVILNRDGQSKIWHDQALKAGDKLRFELGMPEGKRGYATLVAVEDDRAFSLLPEPWRENPFPVTGSAVLPGAVEVAPGGRVILLLVLRSESFETGELLEEVTGSLPDDLESLPGLVLFLPLDTGEE